MKTAAFILLCATPLFYAGAARAAAGPGVAAIDSPAIGASTDEDGIGRFAQGPPADYGPGPELQPSGRMTRLFRSIMEVGSAFPSTLCELIENSHSGGTTARLSSSTGAGFSELLSDESRVVGTGLGYDLGPGVRVQGFGIFDMDENSAYAGPALTYNLEDSIDLTTGVQVPLNEPVSERQDLYFAEIRVLF